MNSRNNITKRIFALGAAVIIALPLFMAQASHADGSFLLQLGTFETRDEATKKWTDVKAGNADLLGTMQGHVAEVMLPPDNTPTYRTQVGPVTSRKAAKTLCKALEARDVTCFVVETAFAASDLSPEMAGDVSAPPVTATQNETPQAVSMPQAAALPEGEQISSSPVAPIEATQPVPATTTVVTPTEVAAIPAPAPVVAPENTPVTVARRNDENFNPNDMKKSGFFRGTFDLNSQLNRQAEETARTVPPAATKQTAEDDDGKPGFFGRLFGRSSTPKQEQVASAVPAVSSTPSSEHVVTTPSYIKGDVQVAEAIRVPVTQDAAQPASTRYVPVADTHTGNDNESELDVDGAGVYWVQVGYFSNETEAHDFFVQLHGLYPQALDNVRIRITRPFATRNAKVSMRMGTFTSGSDVRAICSDANAHGLRCTSIRDTSANAYNPPAASGGATTSKPHKKHLSPLEAVDIPGYQPPVAKPVVNIAAKSQMPGLAPTSQEPSPPPVQTGSYMPSSASVASSVSNPVTGGQWLNLGGFASSQSAWNQWKALQTRVTALNDVKATITGALTHGDSDKYQLRAGPIVTDVDAENICKAIVDTGNICTVAGTE